MSEPLLELVGRHAPFCLIGGKGMPETVGEIFLVMPDSFTYLARSFCTPRSEMVLPGS